MTDFTNVSDEELHEEVERRKREKAVPERILKKLEADCGVLDDLVHDLKSRDASAMNNGGFWEQLEYLREGGVGWDEIRGAMEGEDAGRFCPGCAVRHTKKDLDVGRCAECGTLLCARHSKEKDS